MAVPSLQPATRARNLSSEALSHQLVTQKRQIQQQQEVRNRYMRLARLSQEIASIWGTSDSKLLAVTGLQNGPKISSILIESQDLATLKSLSEQLENDIFLYKSQIINNLNVLSQHNREGSSPLLTQGIEQTMNKVLYLLRNPPENFWTPVAKRIFLYQCREQEHARRVLTKQCRDLNSLIYQLNEIPGYENAQNAPWLHNIVHQLLAKSIPTAYHIGSFTLPSPARNAWLTQLKAWR